MQPEDRLDALLTALRQPERGAATASTTAKRPSASADAELAPLLRAAREVGSLRAAAPDPAFARDLRQRMLARSTDLRLAGDLENATDVPTGYRDQQTTRPTPLRSRAPVWAGMAAAALLAVSVGAATAAAHAGPSSPLFGLHRLEQGIQVAATNDSASRARLHIQYARQWLAELRQAAGQHDGGDAFQSALAAMMQEDGAAESDVAQVTDSATHANLQSALDALQSDERAGLYAALGQLGWGDRIAATNALGQLGGLIPHVTQVHASTQQGGAQITVEGTGFQPGAQLVIDGRPVGQVVSTTPTLLVVNLARGDYLDEVRSVGVSNPDGTAAQAPERGLGSQLSHGADATETAGGENKQGTPGTGDHGGSGTPTPGSHDGEGGGSGTPTPQATRGGDH